MYKNRIYRRLVNSFKYIVKYIVCKECAVVRICVCICGGQRLTLSIFSIFYSSLPYFLRQGFSLNQELSLNDWPMGPQNLPVSSSQC